MLFSIICPEWSCWNHRVWTCFCTVCAESAVPRLWRFCRSPGWRAEQPQEGVENVPERQQELQPLLGLQEDDVGGGHQGLPAGDPQQLQSCLEGLKVTFWGCGSCDFSWDTVERRYRGITCSECADCSGPAWCLDLESPAAACLSGAARTDWGSDQDELEARTF